MVKSAVELDFFRIEKETSAKSQSHKLFVRRRSFRDIQNVISKLNPDLVKSLIVSGSVNQNAIPKSSENGNAFASNTSFSVPSTPYFDQNFLSSLPVYTPTFRPGPEHIPETAPMTIFYNGTVSVFDVPQHQAENIFKVAEKGVEKTMESTDLGLAPPLTDGLQFLEILRRDLPIARTMSLKNFLKKRKQRLTLASPYGHSHLKDYAISGGYKMSGPKD